MADKRAPKQECGKNSPPMPNRRNAPANLCWGFRVGMISGHGMGRIFLQTDSNLR
jgi:hypothetical protein